MFHAARIKLTAWYLLIIMAVSLSFSAVIYRALSNEIERFDRLQRFRIERRMQADIFAPFDADPSQIRIVPEDNADIVADLKHRIITILTLVNGSIFVCAGLLGYMLAGRTLAPIQEMVDEQNRFISDASHELRTPLTALKSMMEVHLRDKSLTPAAARAMMKDGIEEVNTLQTLSDSLLTLTHYQQPALPDTRTRLDIQDILDRSLKKIMPIATGKHISIRSNGTHAMVTGDAASLSELFVIILDNAVKYSPERSTIHISVSKRKTDKFVRIAIRDEGIGIASKDMPFIFDRFYRADSARTKSKTEGYGLGLSIAKRIADVHGGSVSVESSEGNGSTFVVLLS